MIVLLEKRIARESLVPWIGLYTGRFQLIGDVGLPWLIIILVKICMADSVNKKDFHFGRMAKARSRAFRAALTAF